MIWKNFKATILVTIFCLFSAFMWGLYQDPQQGLSLAFNYLALATILGILEISLSADNAVVNAKILKHWSPFWQKMFLTAGLLVAVFGVRLVLPSVAVYFASGLNIVEVFSLAINNPTEYSSILKEFHTVMTSFGGAFLLMLFLNFMFDKDKETFWVPFIEKPLSYVKSYFSYPLGILIIWLVSLSVVSDKQDGFFTAGLYGIGIYAIIHLISVVVEKLSGIDGDNVVSGVAKGGILGFIYLEIIDLSFSGDSLFAGLAVTSDIVLLMLGLAIGAMAVRCLTVYLVRQGTLDEYRYLESGAMYAVGVLSLILLCSSFFHLPEIVTGLIGILFIGIALYHSIKANKDELLTDKGEN